VLFETAYVCGARAAEVCALYVEDLDRRLDDEHVRIHAAGWNSLTRTQPNGCPQIRLFPARSRSWTQLPC
jgi:hypothetical protein